MNRNTAQRPLEGSRAGAGGGRAGGLADRVATQYLVTRGRLSLSDLASFAGDKRAGQAMTARAERAQTRFWRAFRLRNGLRVALQSRLRAEPLRLAAARQPFPRPISAGQNTFARPARNASVRNAPVRNTKTLTRRSAQATLLSRLAQGRGAAGRSAAQFAAARVTRAWPQVRARVGAQQRPFAATAAPLTPPLRSIKSFSLAAEQRLLAALTQIPRQQTAFARRIEARMASARQKVRSGGLQGVRVPALPTFAPVSLFSSAQAGATPEAIVPPSPPLPNALKTGLQTPLIAPLTPFPARPVSQRQIDTDIEPLESETGRKREQNAPDMPARSDFNLRQPLPSVRADASSLPPAAPLIRAAAPDTPFSKPTAPFARRRAPMREQTQAGDIPPGSLPRAVRRPTAPPGSHTATFLLRIQRRGAAQMSETEKLDAGALRADLRRRGGPGAQVAPDTRQLLKDHLRFDPIMARLHRSPAAAGAARQLRADAFTIGADVFFGAEQPDANTREGMGLLAHELTHVGQQMGATGGRVRFFTTAGGDEMEREAQRTARRVMDSLPPASLLHQSATPFRPSLRFAMPRQSQAFETEPPPSQTAATLHNPVEKPPPSVKRANVRAVSYRVYELMQQEAAMGRWRQ